MGLIIPENYDPVLTVRETQEAIKFIRDLFQKEFGRQMNLERVSAPLFVTRSSGVNDNLNGVERPVSFDMLAVPGETVEVVQSLAKWKRIALGRYGFKPGEGLYTNMNAIRRDEIPDNLHSYVVAAAQLHLSVQVFHLTRVSPQYLCDSVHESYLFYTICTPDRWLLGVIEHALRDLNNLSVQNRN